jgi:hypothetical protein
VFWGEAAKEAFDTPPGPSFFGEEEKKKTEFSLFQKYIFHLLLPTGMYLWSSKVLSDQTRRAKPETGKYSFFPWPMPFKLEIN